MPSSKTPQQKVKPVKAACSWIRLSNGLRFLDGKLFNLFINLSNDLANSPCCLMRYFLFLMGCLILGGCDPQVIGYRTETVCLEGTGSGPTVAAWSYDYKTGKVEKQIPAPKTSGGFHCTKTGSIAVPIYAGSILPHP